MSSRCLAATTAVAAVFIAVVSWGLSTGPYIRQPLRHNSWGPLPDLAAPGDIREFIIPEWTTEQAYAKSRLDASASAPHPVPALVGASTDYGVNHKELASLSIEWASNWSWHTSPVIASLRTLPQYVWRVKGLDLHFIHIRADLTTARDCPAAASRIRRLPLLLLHGWPGSVLEFLRIIPLLTTRCGPGGTLFDVVAPSLPGFGFSSVPATPGLGVIATAELFIQLMGRLGYSSRPEGWWVQGGDWGGVIATSIAQVIGAALPEDRAPLRLPPVPARLPLRGVHLNFVPAVPLWSALVYAVSEGLPASLQWMVWGTGEAGRLEYERSGLPLPRLLANLLEITGYMHLQVRPGGSRTSVSFFCIHIPGLFLRLMLRRRGLTL